MSIAAPSNYQEQNQHNLEYTYGIARPSCKVHNVHVINKGTLKIVMLITSTRYFLTIVGMSDMLETIRLNFGDSKKDNVR
mmetsp:Transcript_30815/g.55404  ORF Transcript_30815/g.55404 Transcript_30815/m.55404 type:complete len:80 (+) Transcript_30815:263-502(+)